MLEKNSLFLFLIFFVFDMFYFDIFCFWYVSFWIFWNFMFLKIITVWERYFIASWREKCTLHWNIYVDIMLSLLLLILFQILFIYYFLNIITNFVNALTTLFLNTTFEASLVLKHKAFETLIRFFVVIFEDNQLFHGVDNTFLKCDIWRPLWLF